MTQVPQPSQRTRTGFHLSRLGRLTQKELRETLRDRRTVITLLLMPLLVYPILSLIFRTFLLTGAIAPTTDKPLSYRFAMDYRGPSEAFTRWFDGFVRDVKHLEQNEDPLIAKHLKRTGPSIAKFDEHELSEPTGKDPANFVANVVTAGTVDAGIIVHFGDSESRAGPASGRNRAPTPPRIEIISNINSALSMQAAEYLADYLEAVNRFRMRQRGVLNQMAFLIESTDVSAPQKAKSAISFGTLIPFILVLMTITGAVYPAIDLTAGERERGTMEALVAAPIPRMRILFAKFIAVLTVATLTASLNLIGMMVTIWAFRLEGMLFQSGTFSFASVAQVFALLLLFAAFFSAVLLAVTSFARSFKEAQAYLIPLILLSLAPGVVSLAPGLSLSGPISLVPLLNFVLLARDILHGQVAAAPAIIAILSTLLYAVLAIAFASRIFGTDAILYGSQQSVKDSLRRPKQPQEAISPLAAILCLTCLFPANFVAISVLGRLAPEDIRLPLIIMSIVTVLFFVGVPLLFAWHQRVRLTTGFALQWPRVLPLAAAIIVGLTAWPIALIFITLTHQLITWLGGAESGAAWQEQLVGWSKSYVERWRQLPIGVILLTHAIVPAFAEEWFFRGFLLRSLLRRFKTAAAPILISGLIFGAFHLLSESVISLDRFIPTTLMGMLLGLICWRTGSLLPGILVHVLNNATVVSLAYFQEDLQQLSWFPFRGDELPWVWVLFLLTLSAAAFAGIWFSARPNPHPLAIENRKQSLTP